MIGGTDQIFDRKLPVGGFGFAHRQRGNVVGGIAQGEQLAAVRQWDRILELARPANELAPSSKNGSTPAHIAGVHFQLI